MGAEDGGLVSPSCSCDAVDDGVEFLGGGGEALSKRLISADSGGASR